MPPSTQTTGKRSKADGGAADAPDSSPNSAMPAAEAVRLQERADELEDEKKAADKEVKHLRTEVQNLTRELQRLTVELEKVKQPPLLVGRILDLLVDGRAVVKSSTGPNFVVPIAEFVDRDALEPGTRVSLNQQNLTVVGILPPSHDPLVAATEMTETPDVTYAQVGGLERIIDEVREAVEYPLTRPELYKQIGVQPPKGVLLTGLPGTGKTLLAKAVANATDATFIRLVGSELVQKWIGEGAKRVRDVFELARQKAPSIIFIDEIDAIAARRTDDGHVSGREVERTLMQLLAELDGFEARGDVRILAATNRADILDPAITRPGRFDRIINVPLPSPEEAMAIFQIHSAGMKLDRGVRFQAIVDRLGPVLTGADIRAICTEAGMRAVRAEHAYITHEDFMAAVDRYESGSLTSTMTPHAAGLYA